MSNYTEAVTEARTLVKRSEDDQWRLAELTFQAVEAGTTRKQWAQDVGVSESYAQRLWRVWAQFQDQRDDVSFSDAYGQIAPTSSRDGNIDSAIRNMAPERKAEVARGLLREPQVTREVVKDRDVSATFATAEIAHQNQRHAAHEYAHRDDPINDSVRASKQNVALSTALHEMAEAGLRLSKAMESIARLDIDTSAAQQLGTEETPLRQKLDWIKASIDAQSASFDNELVKLLSADS